MEKIKDKEIVKAVLIEDNPGDSFLIKEMLSEFPGISFEIEHATTLREAYTLLSEKAYDVILLDLGLPDTTGSETLKKVTSKVDNTAIVVITGNSDESRGIEAIKEGAQDYFRKGILDAHQLVSAIRHAIERKKLGNEITRSKNELDIKNIISNSFFEKEDFYKKILDVLLNEFKSEFGYIGIINEEGDLECPSMTYTIWEECNVRDKSVIFKKQDWTGLWGESLKTGSTLYKNSQLVTPEGHMKLTSAIASPIKAGQNIIGQICLANKKKGYDQEDVDSIESYCAYIAPLLHSRLKEEKYREELIESNRKLEISSNYYHAIFQNNGTAVCVINEEGEILLINDRFKHLSRVHDLKRIKQMKIFQFINNGLRKKLSSIKKDQSGPGYGTINYECKFKRLDNAIRNVFLNISLNPTAKEYIFSIQDITSIKETEAELKRHKEHLEEMVRDRTRDLENRNQELQKMNKLFVGREFRIKELKDKITALQMQLNDGKET